MSEDELFARMNHDELESERITAPRYSYWKSVFRVFFRKKINIVVLVILAILILFSYVYPAIIPVVHGIPAAVLFSMTGAIITERVYLVPGIGNVLTTAINAYDNGVIVGVTLFYAVISVTAVILGDILMSMMDPRISFTTKAR